MASEGGRRPARAPDLAQIGKYKIVARIGQGAMGHVYKAHDPVLDRYVAIKTMSAVVLSDPDLSQRFLREAQSAARLNHPNVVTLHEFGEDQGQVFMAMELLEGKDLKDHIKQGTLTTLDDKLGLMEQICDGLAYAHSQQVVHRDLKPANIHVATNGRVKIMDFGLARLGQSEMTRAGTVLGSPNYMSPEQVRGQRADARSDVFSLGSVFYEILSGRRAFDGETMAATMYQVTDADPRPLLDLVPDLPPILAAFVHKALEKDGDRRYQDAREMLNALEICRRVLDGALDEQEGMATLRESQTVVQSEAPLEDLVPGSPDSVMSGAATVQGGAPTVTRGSTTRQGAIRGSGAVGSGVRSGSRGRRGSQPSAPAETAPPSLPASRTPLYVAVGGGLVAVGIAIAFGAVYFTRPQPAPQQGSSQSALVAVAIDSQLDVARKSLEFKDLRGAFGAAEKALKLDPTNADALAIQRQAKSALDEVEAAVREAREAAQAGDTEKATKAVSRVLGLMPDHPVAVELSAQLNSRFKAQADEAQAGMKRAAEGAQRANATSLREFADAARLARQAEDLYGQKQYTQATQKFLEARRGYEASRLSAQEMAARPVPTSAPAATIPTPPPTVPTPAPTPVPTIAPPVTAPPPPVTVPPAASVPSDEAAVREAVSDFKRAIETKDLGLYKSLRPGLSVEDERKLRAAFEAVKTQQVDFAIESLAIEGGQAIVKVTRTGSVNGRPVQPIRQVLRLAKGPSGWTIRDVGQ